MRHLSPALLLATSLLALPAHAARSPAAVLDANKIATGGDAWKRKKALDLQYGYVGQGLTGTMASLDDLVHGAFVDSYAIPPNVGATGYDGEQAWEKEPSGTVTYQAGGDTIPLAITESYQDRNLWWRKDRGGAAVESLGRKSEHGVNFDVLRVTPTGGAALECWFDAKTHVLARTIELQGTQTITTFYSDYKPVDGVQLAHKIVIDDSSGPQGPADADADIGALPQGAGSCALRQARRAPRRLFHRRRRDRNDRTVPAPQQPHLCRRIR